MRLARIYVRFYKSFNFDYERRAHPKGEPEPWDMIEGNWYPFVRMPLDEAVTTVVGANESGKSQLLNAIEMLITGEGIDRSDFCRYSGFFSVAKGQMRMPDFGGEFEVVTDDDANAVRTKLGLNVPKGKTFHLFRFNGAPPVAYLVGSGAPVQLTEGAIALLPEVLPQVFRLQEKLSLPASMPIFKLSPNATAPFADYKQRSTITKWFMGKGYGSPEAVQQDAKAIYDVLQPDGSARRSQTEQEYAIGRDLVLLVSDIDELAFDDLDKALLDGRHGYVEGVVQKIDHAMARHLNFPRWWAQDREFSLRVACRETDIVFTIHDRTGTEYSFNERSQGLQFFLSYYVQLLARRHRAPEGQAQILLMDEPDAYLSSQGQQDLLRILEDFARPEDRSREDQVIYVTHSPFLINRNAAERIRVLDKGTGEEGTRVVKDVARNHYEPLRSSLGSFVAETAFIGGANLVVEGPADQILLAGMSSYLRSAAGASRLDSIDLNEVTIVPSGSASAIPYMVYLARGRDEVKPPCVALFDGDKSGREAAAMMKRDPVRGRQVLKPEYVVVLDSWAATASPVVGDGVSVREPEDLVALPVAVAACRAFARDVLATPEEELDSLTERGLADAIKRRNGEMWPAIEEAFAAAYPGEHIDKVPFAKEVVAHLNDARRSGTQPDGVGDTAENFRLLLTHLAAKLRAAAREEDDRRLNNRLKRALDRFLTDHLGGASRDQGAIMIAEVQSALDESADSDQVRIALGALRRDFHLDEDLTSQIDDFAEFRQRVSNLQYVSRFAHQDADAAAAGAAPEPGAAGGSAAEPEAPAAADAAPDAAAAEAPTAAAAE